jgi:acyl-CoA dehydrogenase
MRTCPARASKQSEGVVISDQISSRFESPDRAERYRAQLLDFMEAYVYPAEPVYDAQIRESGNPHHHPVIVEDLKSEARQRGFVELVPSAPTIGCRVVQS